MSNKAINDILEMVTFIRDNAATKEDLKNEIDQLRQETRADIKQVRAEMATKEDIKKVRAEMATKEDLKKVRAEMATKEDLKKVRAEMATKKDIKKVRSEMATKSDFKKLDKRVASLEKEMKEQKIEIQAHREETKKQGKEIKDITKQILDQKLENRYFHSQMATKEDLKNYATKEDLLSFKSEIIQHIDGFAVKLNKYDAEISANRLSIDRLDTRMTKIETK